MQGGVLTNDEVQPQTGLSAPPLGLEPRLRVPKTRVLPLHHGGLLELLCQFLPTFFQLFRKYVAVNYATTLQNKLSALSIN